MAHQSVGAMLRPREDEHRVHLRPLQQLGEECALPLARHGIDRVRHRVDRLRAETDLNDERLAKIFAGERFDFGRHRRAEEQRLTVGRNVAHDLVDLRRESHVEHPVGLVEDQHFEIVEHQVLSLEVVDQAAWRRDYDVDPAAKRRLLGSKRDATEDLRDPEAAVASILLEALANLGRELARWGENEGPKSPGAAKKALDDRERECGGLAGTCLGQPDQVSPLEGEGDRLRLNWRRVPVPRVANGVDQLWREAEQLECGERFNCRLHVTYCAGSARLRGACPGTGAPSAAPCWRAPEVEIFGRAAKCAALQRANVPSGWNRLHGNAQGAPCIKCKYINDLAPPTPRL